MNDQLPLSLVIVVWLWTWITKNFVISSSGRVPPSWRFESKFERSSNIRGDNWARQDLIPVQRRDRRNKAGLRKWNLFCISHQRTNDGRRCHSFYKTAYFLLHDGRRGDGGWGGGRRWSKKIIWGSLAPTGCTLNRRIFLCFASRIECGSTILHSTLIYGLLIAITVFLPSFIVSMSYWVVYCTCW